MLFANDVVKRIYFIITIAITIPMILFSCFDALKLKELLLEKEGKKLIEVASVLNDRLEGSFDDILVKEKAKGLSEKEQLKILNKHLQPLVMEVAKEYPNCGLGFYCKKLGRRVAVGPNFSPDKLRPVTDPSILRVYQTGRVQVIFVNNSNTWNGKKVLSVVYPIYRQGKLIGHIWANHKVEDINSEFYSLLAQRLFLTFLIWLVITATVWWGFRKLKLSLANIINQIEKEDDSCYHSNDFPALNPLLQTIISLRKRLKRESNFLQWILETVPGIVIAIDNDKRIVLANQSTYQWLGLTKEKDNLVGEDFSSISESIDKTEQEKALLIQALEDNKTFYREKVQYSQGVVLQYDASPIIDSGSKEKLGAVCYVHDISKEEEKNKKLQEITDKYLVEAKNLRQLIDATPLAIVAIDEQKNITTVNRTFLSWYYQHSCEDLIGDSFVKKIVKLEGISEDQSPTLQALGDKKIENAIIDVLGRKISINAYPIKDIKNQKILGAVSIAQDITEIKEKEDKLAQQTELLNLAQDYIVIRDINDKIIFWNTGAEIGYGWREEEALGKNSHQLLKTKLPQPREDIMLELREKGYWVGELTHTRKNGNQVIVESHWSLKRDENGNPLTIMAINRDITQLREKQIKEEELTIQYLNEARKLNGLVELCPLPIVVLDSQGNVAMANKAFMNYHTKFIRKEIIKKPYRIISDSLGIEYEKSKVVRALRGEEIIADYSTVGDRQWIINALPLRDADEGKIIGAMAIYHDITEHERIREEMVKLDRLNIVGQMAAGVAHEVRNPMTAARGYLQLLMRKLGEDSHRQLNIVLQEIDRANSIISDFLSLARNKISNKKQQKINDIIEAIYPLIYGEAIRKGINVTLELAEDTPMAYLEDKEIKQLILNLSRNGIEAMEEKGQLTIKTKNRNGRIELIVSDIGSGIPKDKLDKIFDPFYTSKDHGTGLGLAICASIVEHHQGTILVNSKEGLGTEFIIILNPLETELSKIG